METDNQIVIIESLLESAPQIDLVEDLRDLYMACNELTRDQIESRIIAMGTENVFRLKRFREAIIKKKNQFMLLRDAILKDLPNESDWEYPKVCPGQQIQKTYLEGPGYYLSLLDILKSGAYEQGTIISANDPLSSDMSSFETDDQEEWIRRIECYLDKNNIDPDKYIRKEIIYTFKHEAAEMLSEVAEKVELIDNVIRNFLRETPTREGLLFTVAIDKWASIVNSSVFDERATADDLLQLLNLNSRYSGIVIRKGRESWLLALVYVLSNFYEDFEKTNRQSWQKDMVRLLGLNWEFYCKKKRTLNDGGGVEMNAFLNEIIMCLKQYNLLRNTGLDGTRLNDFFEQTDIKKNEKLTK